MVNNTAAVMVQMRNSNSSWEMYTFLKNLEIPVNISGISLNDCGREFGIFQVRAEFSQVRVSDVTVSLGIRGLQQCGQTNK